MPTRYNWMADTDAKAFQTLIELRRNMSAGEKLLQVLEMAEMLIRATEDRVRKDHPRADEREVFLRAAVLRLGADTVKRVYGWSPESVPGK